MFVNLTTGLPFRFLDLEEFVILKGSLDELLTQHLVSIKKFELLPCGRNVGIEISIWKLNIIMICFRSTLKLTILM
jgi:hypothetical protein